MLILSSFLVEFEVQIKMEALKIVWMKKIVKKWGFKVVVTKKYLE